MRYLDYFNQSYIFLDITNTNITLSPNGSGDVEVDSGLVVGGNTVFTLQNNYD